MPKRLHATNYLSLTLMLVLLAGCTGSPEGLTPVQGFDSERYLGTWYEIARLDHSFERGLTRVTANYSRRVDGGIQVINRGYDEKEKSWQEAEGRAYFTGSPDLGALKVSFFGPFYGAYNIIALDNAGYQWAMVCGYNRDYLWILSRQPTLEHTTLEKLLELAQKNGFATDALIFVQH